MSSYLSGKNKLRECRVDSALQVRPGDKNKSDKGACLEASLTVEAALVLPLILFSMILLMMPLHMMNTDRKVQKVCEDVAGDVSKYLYTINEYNRGRMGSGSSGGSGESLSGSEVSDGNGFGTSNTSGSGSSGESSSGSSFSDRNLDSNVIGDESFNGSSAGGNPSSPDSTLSTYMDIADGPALGAFAAARIKSEIDDERLKIVNVLNSDLDSHDDMVTVRIDYAYKLPFNVFDLGFLQQEAVASRRAWVGADGSAEKSEEVTDDEWVYIGKNPTRYHLSATCHYLYNDWKRAVVGTNGKAGGKSPCDICGRNAVPGQTVYVTPNGDKYHTDTSCSAMKSYPEMVRRSEVEHLGCCSYCEKHFKKKNENVPE